MYSCQQYKNKKGRPLPPSEGLITFVLQNMYKHLTREQRYAIYLGRQKGETLEIIARSIGVHKSTVSRELRRIRHHVASTCGTKPMIRHVHVKDNLLETGH